MTSAFRAAVEAKDLDAMRGALHPDVTFRSPVVYKPYEGRDAVMVLLGTR
jgi:ketosteroid isomerase-like protein